MRGFLSGFVAALPLVDVGASAPQPPRVRDAIDDLSTVGLEKLHQYQLKNPQGSCTTRNAAKRREWYDLHDDFSPLRSLIGLSTGATFYRRRG
jgi:hypothetical protein